MPNSKYKNKNGKNSRISRVTSLVISSSDVEEFTNDIYWYGQWSRWYDPLLLSHLSSKLQRAIVRLTTVQWNSVITITNFGLPIDNLHGYHYNCYNWWGLMQIVISEFECTLIIKYLPFVIFGLGICSLDYSRFKKSGLSLTQFKALNCRFWHYLDK